MGISLNFNDNYIQQLERDKGSVDEILARIEKYVDLVKEDDALLAETSADNNTLVASINEKTVEILPLQARLAEFKDEQKQYTSQIRQLDQEKRDMDTAIKTHRKTIASYEEEIKNICDREENSEYDDDVHILIVCFYL